jgi:putative intracellular protease/amidase
MKLSNSLQRVVALVLFTLANTCDIEAQSKERYQVAIFLYPGVELLDFAGPGEVFGATSGFRVFTMSADGKDITSQGFVTVKPQYSIDNAPPADIIIFPGGGSNATSRDPRVMTWIEKQNKTGSFFMSVCTGAEILGKAGLLEGKKVTTFHGFLSGLQAQLPNSEVLANTRFVDSGKIITTAGVSAGIDGALHLVSRLKGLDVAKATAFYMEYDKWKPEEGLVDFTNEYLEKLKTPTSGPETKIKTPSIGSAQFPYEGEIKNLAFELIEKKQPVPAANVLEEGIKLFPKSGALYIELANVYTRLGKPAPITETELFSLIGSGKIDDATARYEKDKKLFPGWIIFRENQMNDLGYHMLMMEKNAPAAIKVFQLNVNAYPESANAYDSLGEALLTAGNKAEAKECYQKSLALDPQNSNARKVLAQLE